MYDLIASLYELFYYSADGFSDNIYNEGLYSIVFLVLAISSMLFMTIFYYLPGHPRYSRWFHWLIVAAINFVINFSFTFIFVRNTFSVSGFQYTTEYFSFALVSGFVSFIIFTLFSYSFRWWSKSGAKTPIPS